MTRDHETEGGREQARGKENGKREREKGRTDRGGANERQERDGRKAGRWPCRGGEPCVRINTDSAPIGRGERERERRELLGVSDLPRAASQAAAAAAAVRRTVRAVRVSSVPSVPARQRSADFSGLGFPPPRSIPSTGEGRRTLRGFVKLPHE